MSDWAYVLRVRPGGFWRPLIAVVLAHAVAVQALLIALGGFSLAANADQSAPAFELCSHDANGATQSPTRIPDQSGCAHCIFCFAGAHHAVIGAAPAASHRVNVAITPPGVGTATASRNLVGWTAGQKFHTRRFCISRIWRKGARRFRTRHTY